MINSVNRSRILKFLPLLILLLSGIGIIFFRFPAIPKFLAYDEVEFSKLALSLDGKTYSVYSPLATGHSTLYFYIILLSFKLFGVTQFALRLPSAISGILCLLIFTAIIHTITRNRSASLLAGVILLTSRWFFNFSRFAFEPTFLLLLELSSLYFLFRYFRDKRNFYLILTGFFSGLTFNSYTPGRIFFLLVLGILVLKLYKKPFKLVSLKVILYAAVPFIILAAPLQSYLLTHQDIRFNQLSYLSNDRLSISEKANFFVGNIISTSGMFIFKGDPNGKHNYPFKPALNPLLGLLAFAGIYLALKNFGKPENKLFLGYFVISIIPTLFVYAWENPSMLRTYTALPAIAYFASLPVLYVSGLKKRFRPKILLFILGTILLLSSLYELRTYFVYQSQVFLHSFEVKQNLKKAITCPNVLECNK